MKFSMSENLYEILGASENCTQDEIKKCYQKQAMQWHPDRNPSRRQYAEERFKLIGYAYKVLSNPDLRAEYDAYLTSRQQKAFSFAPGVSDADAAKMFFEQMLDLAIELARRGFDAAKIHKTLVSLDCPESIAKAVSEMVAKVGRESPKEDNKAEPVAQHEYAGFWRRAGAVFVDGIVMYIPFSIIYLLPNIDPYSGEWMIASTVIGWVYYASFESGKHQATLGKRAMGIKVADVHGNRISFGRAMVRRLGTLVDLITLNIGYLIQPFTKRRQALHDIIAGAVVLRTRKEGEWSGVGIAVILLAFVAFFGMIAAIAVPQYQYYTTRAQLAGAIQAISQFKYPVAKFMIDSGRPPATLANLGINLPPSIGIDKDGTLFATMPSDAAGPLRAKHITLTPYVSSENRIEWACGSPDIEKIYLPTDCQVENLPEGATDIVAFFKIRQEAAQKAEKDRVSEAVSDLEERFPAFNAKSPVFNPKYVDIVVARQRELIEKGLSPSEALRKAGHEVAKEEGL
jgi:curved DNA-binding protein CbpA